MVSLITKGALLTSAVLLCGCQLSYFVKSGYGQLELMNQRVSINEALQDSKLSEEQKKKLLLAEEAKKFAEEILKLKKSDNYSKYVQLDRPYVTYVVSAAPKWELTQHQWHYPIVGKMPYKGYFKLDDAKTEQENLKSENLDTYLRGVSAYSTLGWFNDPLLSSMLRYSDYDLVNTIIHETVHATLYIKHAADFNERLATFMGNKGAELFFLKKEGPESKTLADVKKINEDHHTFSQFISKEISDLKAWYQNITEKNEELRSSRIKSIQAHFTEQIVPQLKTETYLKFPEIELNNARLLVYRTYMNDLADFEKLYQASKGDFQLFMENCKKLETAKDPEAELKTIISSISL